MPFKGTKKEKKNAYFAKLIDYCESKPMALLVGIDHVGSKQMQEIRIATRGKAIVLMGKNTMIRTALRQRIEETEDEGLERLLSNINGNFGFIFLEDPKYLEEVREIIVGNKVPAMAKAGTIAPVDVHLAAGPSGLEPSQTSFFQALNIPTKIVKGAIEITSAVHLVKAGEKVSLSAQALLTKLGMKPFEYGMVIQSVYQDGAVFDAAVLDITDEVLTAKFMNGVANVAAFGREIGVPTEAGLPHMMTNAFKNIVSTIVDIDFSGGEEADKVKAILSDPEALAAMQAAAASGPAAGGDSGAAAGGAAAAAAVEEEEEEDMEFDLFD